MIRFTFNKICIYSETTLLILEDCLSEQESLLYLPPLHHRQLCAGPTSDRTQNLRGCEVTAEAAQAHGEAGEWGEVMIISCAGEAGGQHQWQRGGGERDPHAAGRTPAHGVWQGNLSNEQYTQV